MMFVMRFLFFIMFYMYVGAVSAVPAVVDYVYDGDTFTADVMLPPDVSVDVRVRLINIDTPEIRGKCQYEKDLAQQAKRALQALIPRGTIVELENIKDDKYLGRIDANVILPDGRDAGAVLIKMGLGRRYKGGRRDPWCKNKI